MCLVRAQLSCAIVAFCQRRPHLCTCRLPCTLLRPMKRSELLDLARYEVDANASVESSVHTDGLRRASYTARMKKSSKSTAGKSR